MEPIISSLEQGVERILLRTRSSSDSSDSSSQQSQQSQQSRFHPHMAVHVQGRIAVNLENGFICTLDMSLVGSDSHSRTEMTVCNQDSPYDEVFDLSFHGGGERLLVFGKLNKQFAVDVYFIGEPGRISLWNVVQEYVLEKEMVEGKSFSFSQDESDSPMKDASTPFFVEPFQVSFHPRSSNHVLILGSNNQFFMVHVCPITMRVVVESSVIPMEPTGWRRRIRFFSFSASLDDSLDCGWRGFFLDFTVFFITDGGDVYCLCPVIPRGVAFEKNFLVAIRDEAKEEKNAEVVKFMESVLSYFPSPASHREISVPIDAEVSAPGFILARSPATQCVHAYAEGSASGVSGFRVIRPNHTSSTYICVVDASDYVDVFSLKHDIIPSVRFGKEKEEFGMSGGGMSLSLVHSYHVPGLSKKSPLVHMHPMIVQGGDPYGTVVPVFVENSMKAMVFQFVEESSARGKDIVSKVARYFESEDECAMAVVTLPWKPNFVMVWMKSMEFHALPLVHPASEKDGSDHDVDDVGDPLGHIDIDPSRIQRLLDAHDAQKIYFRDDESDDADVDDDSDDDFDDSSRKKREASPSRVMRGVEEIDARLEEALTKLRLHSFKMPVNDDQVMEALYAEGRFMMDNVLFVLQDAEKSIIQGVNELRAKIESMENVERRFTKFIRTECELLQDVEICLKRNERIREKSRELRERLSEQDVPSFAQESLWKEVEMMDRKFVPWAEEREKKVKRMIQVLDRSGRMWSRKARKPEEKDRMMKLREQLHVLERRIQMIKEVS
eukprot:TRINITY_DN2508_c0_g1_i1.p1 TRINITY_DN2508_c0_g1~~TRINITY_DN2508_c0_g1_i1.p1  ORF type:complete len:828 (+),score=233.89 TRINITY_DN2508_c0_g1_i1:147-2486(+)